MSAKMVPFVGYQPASDRELFTLRLPCGSLWGGLGAMTYRTKYRLPATGAQEHVCLCPSCLTFETLWFLDGILIPTIKFSQEEDGRVYHNCNQGLIWAVPAIPCLGGKAPDIVAMAIHTDLYF